MLPHSSQSHYCQSTFSSFVMGRAGDTVPLCHPKPALMHPHMQQISMHITARQASLPIPPGMESRGQRQLSQPSPTRPVESQTPQMLYITSSLHHRRLLALTACLGLGMRSIAALQCFEISSDVMDLSNLCLLFNRPRCWG